MGGTYFPMWYRFHFTIEVMEMFFLMTKEPAAATFGCVWDKPPLLCNNSQIA